MMLFSYLFSWISSCFLSIQALIAPPYCVGCRNFLKDYSVLCKSCQEYLKPVPSHCITINAQHTLRVHAVSRYEEPLKSLILAKSYGDYTASIQLARLMFDHSIIKQLEFDCIVPVPLHWTRTSWRGYNQSLVIAQELARFTGKPVIELIKRHKRTPFLSSVQATDRQKTIHRAFKINEHYADHKGLKIVLIDDVMTTGSTLNACAQALVAVQPAQMHALVACRVVQAL